MDGLKVVLVVFGLVYHGGDFNIDFRVIGSYNNYRECRSALASFLVSNGFPKRKIVLIDRKKKIFRFFEIKCRLNRIDNERRG